MAANGAFAVLVALFFSTGYGRHECERPCSENADPKECYHHFTLTLDFHKCENAKNEECRRNLAISVNGRSPGPSIYACKDDTLTVDVKNALPFGMETSIHWHGLRQRRTPFMDGVPMITQCPIHSGTTFRYRMKLDQGGTFYYHAHSVRQQIDGLYGALIVREHPTVNEKVLLFAPRLGELTSLQSGAVTELSSAELKSFAYHLGDRDKPGRMRLINAAAVDCPLNIISKGKELKIEAVDGNKVKPTRVTRFSLYPGERVDITSGFDFEITGRNMCDGRRLVTNTTAEKPPHQRDLIEYYKRLDSASDANPDEEHYKIYLPFGTAEYSSADNPVDMRYKLGEILPYVPSYINGVADTVSVKQFRRTSLLYPSTPVLSRADEIEEDVVCPWGTRAKRCSDGNFCECLNILKLPYNKTVDLVIVDEGDASAGEEQTIHVHGNKVRVIGMASFEHPIEAREIKKFIESGKEELKLVSPIEKDTVVVPKMGYVILRMRTDNPGYWLLESIPSKAESGMGLEMVLHVPEESGDVSVPEGFPRCSNFKPRDLVIIDE